MITFQSMRDSLPSINLTTLTVIRRLSTIISLLMIYFRSVHPIRLKLLLEKKKLQNSRRRSEVGVDLQPV